MVDPHTYPGRPWPLSTLTVRHTDRYLRKSFQQIQDRLDPATVIFLGDLFDGGREWSTPPGGSKESESVDKRWRKYGESFWFNEYRRFAHIFTDIWLKGALQRSQDRKIIASLPGNHDLGLGMGIRLPVRKRFNAYFGFGNRIDFLGNHSFVSVDTVSLSAKGQPNLPPADEQGVEAQAHTPEDISKPTETFLLNTKATKGRIIEQALRVQRGEPENELQDHTVLDIPSSRIAQTLKQRPDYPDIPSILLTHIPLFRAAATPCGPYRERHPPSKSSSGGTLERDDRNAIPIQAGVQYQNVLEPEISKEIIDNVGNLEYAFSGDDHDYCEVVHRGYTSRNKGIREITVKSMSWAMGVRKPGFLMLSLWNPVNAEGKSMRPSAGQSASATMQTHLCLLPDQLSVLMTYGCLIALTVFAMLVQAIIMSYKGSEKDGDSQNELLPMSKYDASKDGGRDGLSGQSWDDSQSEKTSSITTNGSTQSHLAARSNATRTRSSSPFNGYAMPTTRTRAGSMQQKMLASTHGSLDERKDFDAVSLDDRRPRRAGHLTRAYRKFIRSLAQIASMALLWYAWLLYS